MKEIISLGRELRKLRKETGESLIEASKKLNVNRSHLNKIELGQSRPSRKLLNLIVAHFSLENDKADQLLQLGGYDTGKVVVTNTRGKEEKSMKNSQPIVQPSAANINIDPGKPTLYTDSIFINSSDFGLVVDFARRVGPEQHFVVTSVGMSFEHAKKLAEVLDDHLEKHER